MLWHPLWRATRFVLSLAVGLVAIVEVQAQEYRALDLETDAGTNAEGDEAPPASALRGLLASPAFERAASKSVYFFPGEGSADNAWMYTAHPRAADDLHWNSDPGTRSGVLDRIVATHANAVIMSYWGQDMQQWSPMALDGGSVRGLLEAAEGKALVIVPALESGFDPANPDGPHFRFADDFPYENGLFSQAHLAPRVLTRLLEICALFAEHPNVWARMYDRSGQPRYVVHVLGAYAQRMPTVLGALPGMTVGAAFDALARAVEATLGMRIGFTLDAGYGEPETFPFLPETVGAGLERAESVLAIQLFLSEMRGGRVLWNPPFAPPFDNNESNLHGLMEGKLQLLDAWRKTGLPVIYDVSPGFDGRFVWAAAGGSFWGDNYDYTWDEWRNLQSENKRSEYVGISFNTWNGYTEGYCGVPTLEHGMTVYDWLTDLFAPEARSCNHVEYLDGKPAYRVSGAICEKWQALLGRRGALGAPISDELALDRSKVVRFLDGSIYRTDDYGVREVHGSIYQEYERRGFEKSCLGLPVADEATVEDGWISSFEHGEIAVRASSHRALVRCDSTD